MKKIAKFDSIIPYDLDIAKAQDAVAIDSKKVLRKPTMDYGYRGDFQPPEFNLYEIGIIEDVESYVRQAFQKKTALMFKEGEDFRGKNKKTITYLNKRIRQIEAVSNIPWRSLLRETGYYLTSRSNFFWVIVRDSSRSGGRTKGGDKPIAAFFPLAPETVEIKKDQKTGKIEKYRQRMPDGRIKEFEPSEIIHFHAYRKTGFNFGTPTIISVKDDIRALRRIEENIELLIYQNLFPIFHYKVGTELKPAGQVRLPDGSVMDEVEYIRLKISQMPSEGGIVTPERHEIEYIGSEGKSLRAEGYLDYFKRRVFAGLGVSAVDYGEGDTANRATADNMSRAMVDSVKDYQDILGEQINHNVIKPLLAEANFGFDVLDDDNFVEFLFKEVDVDTQLKKNVNAQLLYGGNISDINEARAITGGEPITPEQEKLMFLNRVTIPEIKLKTNSAEKLANMQIEAQKEMTELQLSHEKETQGNGEAMKHIVAAHTTKTATSRGGGKSSKSVTKVHPKAQKQIIQMSRPTNQHGTKTGPQKSKLDSFTYNDSIATSRWNELKSDILNHVKTKDLNQAWLDTVISIALTNLRDRYTKLLDTEVVRGYRSLRAVPSMPGMMQASSYFNSTLTAYMDNLIRTVKSRVNAELNKTFKLIPKDVLLTNISDIFDKMEYRLQFFDATERDRAFNIGRALAIKEMGYSFAHIQVDSNCEECLNQDHTLELDVLVFDSVPPTHSNCSCKVVLSDFTKDQEDCILKVKRQLRSENPSWSEQRIKSAAVTICRASK